MLIESDEIYPQLKILLDDSRESDTYFSIHNAISDCLSRVVKIINDIEACTAAKNARHKYAEALQGLGER